MATDKQIDVVTQHYIIAAVWADCEEGTHPKVPKKEAADAREDCKAFIEQCERSPHGDLFAKAMERFHDGYGRHPDAGSAEAAFGHDFWLTRQHHGVGFWDRRELDVTLDGEEVERKLGRERGITLGDLLTEEAHKAGECCPYQSRGWFYLS